MTALRHLAADASLEQVECIHEAPKAVFDGQSSTSSTTLSATGSGVINSRGERKGWDAIPPPAPDEGYVLLLQKLLQAATL